MCTRSRRWKSRKARRHWGWTSGNFWRGSKRPGSKGLSGLQAVIGRTFRVDLDRRSGQVTEVRGLDAVRLTTPRKSLRIETIDGESVNHVLMTLRL